MRILPYGRCALLLEPDDAADVLPLARILATDSDVTEIVPAARTVLLQVRPGSLEAVRRRIGAMGGVTDADRRISGPAGAAASDPVVLDVHYDGPDLASTAADVGLDVDALVRVHTAGEYTVAFCGFAPGFAYLSGLDPTLHVGRLDEPRTRVPAGSVAIAGEFASVYPRPSPGGWRLLGHTDAPLWDLDRDRPALLAPGTRVRFRAVP